MFSFIRFHIFDEKSDNFNFSWKQVIQSLQKWFHCICRPRKPMFRYQNYDSMSSKSDFMADYLISRKSAGHASALEKCPKWVLHPYFFSGNMSKMILRFLLKKLAPPMTDTGGRGCKGDPSITWTRKENGVK